MLEVLAATRHSGPDDKMAPVLSKCCQMPIAAGHIRHILRCRKQRKRMSEYEHLRLVSLWLSAFSLHSTVSFALTSCMHLLPLHVVL